MLYIPAIAFVGAAMLPSPVSQSRASFELRGSVPVSCHAEILDQEYSGEALNLVVGERCNSSYTLQLRLPAGSNAARVQFGGRDVPVRNGIIAIRRSAFSGSLLAGEPLSIRFSEGGAADGLQTLAIEALADSAF